MAICHNLPRNASNPDGVAAKVAPRAASPVQVVGDRGRRKWMRGSRPQQRVGVFGSCSGGRHASLCLQQKDVDACVDL
jgi:carboxymethylenebutenolidase